MGSLLVVAPQPVPDAVDSCRHGQPTVAAGVWLDCLGATQRALVHQGQVVTRSAYTLGMSYVLPATDLCSPGGSDDDSLEAA